MNQISPRFAFGSLLFLVTAARALALDALPETAPAKAELGKLLYFEKRISLDNTVSCNSCHDANKGGVDGKQFSSGVGGKLGGRNAPTVWNAAFHSVQFWDGRAATLEDQAKGPMLNPVEMAMPNHDEVVARLKKIQGYREKFVKAFGSDEITIDRVAQAIASYERTLITLNSPYDRYAKGKKSALSPAAKRGLALVQSVGCVSCHSGPNFAGPSLPTGTGFYQKFPLIPGSDFEKKYKLADDIGRAAVTKSDADRNMFRVPTWRNVALTAPYFHNGSVASLEEAVRVMAKTQLGRTLPEKDVSDITAFLRSLTGSVPPQTEPVLPN